MHSTPASASRPASAPVYGSWPLLVVTGAAAVAVGTGVADALVALGAVVVLDGVEVLGVGVLGVLGAAGVGVGEAFELPPPPPDCPEPKGSEYWSSPAPCASAAEGAASTSSEAASAMRRRTDMGRQCNPAFG